jgi:hypothetical protein
MVSYARGRVSSCRPSRAARRMAAMS